jgi:hypothetical protein
MNTRVRVAILAGAAVVVLGLAMSAASAPDPISRADFSSSLLQLQALAAEGEFSGGSGQISSPTCTTSPGSPDLSCDRPFDPDNEITIAVDPENPNHLAAGSNDYFLLPKGATLIARVPTGLFTSTDGGSTWLDGQVPMGNGGGGGNGDPVVGFNAKYDLVHMTQLSAGCGQAGPWCGHISVSVSTSKDGGKTFGSPVTVAQGSGSLTPSAQGVFNDKPWMTVDNSPSSPTFGRVYVTYTQFELSKGGYLRSPIMATWSDDGGKKWTKAVEISGASESLCEYQETGAANQCDEDQFSVPVVLRNGTVVVHFANAQNESDWESPQEFESQILVVRSTDGGATWGDPIRVAALEDGGGTDYPISAAGRATQTGYQFRTQTVQGMTADPMTDDLYAFWTDNSEGTHDVATPITQSQVYISKSANGGMTWSAPQQITSTPSDNWMAWAAAYNGKVGILYMSAASPDAAHPDRGKTYVVNFRSSTDGGATWSSAQPLNSTPSYVNYSMWFRAPTSSGCTPLCATFIGDYNGLVAAPAAGGAVAFHGVWTDMSRVAIYPELGNRTGAPQDAFYAKR